jgi:class 3 adenylate cyclase
VHFDKRGTGLSDRTAGLPTLEERADDIRAVMDAVGMECAAIVGPSEGGQAAIYFAATFPERVSQLVLMTTAAGAGMFSDEARAAGLERLDSLINSIEEVWGTGMTMYALSGDTAGTADLDVQARFERNCATPHATADVLRRTMTGDATDILGTISAPTLVISRAGDPIIPREAGPKLAAAIPNARHVELPGAFHIGGAPEYEDDALDEIEQFLTGGRTTVAVDRVLATVLFTDIVQSTERAAAATDAKWRELLDAHDRAVRQELERHRGTEVKTTGDGFLATFDGPARAVRCAQAAIARARGIGLELRSGVHTGEVERRGDDIAGLGVHIASRVAGLATAGQVLVSSTVRDLTVGSGLEFEDAGTHELKGVPGTWQLLRVMA